MIEPKTIVRLDSAPDSSSRASVADLRTPVTVAPLTATSAEAAGRGSGSVSLRWVFRRWTALRSKPRAISATQMSITSNATLETRPRGCDGATPAPPCVLGVG